MSGHSPSIDRVRPRDRSLWGKRCSRLPGSGKLGEDILLIPHLRLGWKGVGETLPYPTWAL